MSIEHTCLFAKMSSTASLSSSSANILISSSLASPIRSLSLESTTKMRPCKQNNTQLSKGNKNKENIDTYKDIKKYTYILIKTANKLMLSILHLISIKSTVFKKLNILQISF